MSDSLFTEQITLYNYQNRLGRTLGSKMHWEEETGIITQFLAKHKTPIYSDLLQALTYSLPGIHFSIGSASYTLQRLSAGVIVFLSSSKQT